MTATADPPPPPAALESKWPYRFEIMPLDQLQVDDTYQRPLTSFWKVVVEKFDPALVGTLIVSERNNGTKAIIDGQTRWEAMTQLGLTGAPCLIYEGLSKADEAQLFANLQTQRRGMASYHRFRAQLIAKNKRAVDVAKIATNVGFELGKQERANTIRSVAALEKCWNFSPEHLEDVLMVIRDSWTVDDREAVAADIISGLSHFLRHQEKVDMDRLVNRLEAISPSLLKHRVSALREGRGGQKGGGATLMSEAILGEYSRRR